MHNLQMKTVVKLNFYPVDQVLCRLRNYLFSASSLVPYCHQLCYNLSVQYLDASVDSEQDTGTESSLWNPLA